MSQVEDTIEVKVQPTIYVEVLMPSGVVQVFDRPTVAEVLSMGAQGIPGPAGTPGASAILGTWEGEWDSGTIYEPLSLVEYEGSTYLQAGTGLTNIEPPVPPWELVAAKGEPADPFQFVHTQMTPTNPWVVNHGLDGYPNVTVVDSTEREVVGDIRYLDTNQIEITFSAAFTGKAYVS
jgi:hypothetical protein